MTGVWAPRDVRLRPCLAAGRGAVLTGREVVTGVRSPKTFALSPLRQGFAWREAVTGSKAVGEERAMTGVQAPETPRLNDGGATFRLTANGASAAVTGLHPRRREVATGAPHPLTLGGRETSLHVSGPKR